MDYRAGQVIKPLRVAFKAHQLLILDTGYRWVHYAPQAQNYALTVQLDDQDVPQQLYADICDGQGIDPDGVPFVNDLYLDVIAVCDVLPSGVWQVTETEIIDQQDLQDAVEQGRVTAAQAELAWMEARAVEEALCSNTFAPVEVVQAYLAGSIG